MPSINLLETRNKQRLDGTYTEDLSGEQAWKGRKSKGMERMPSDIAEACHVLRFSLISKLDCTKVCSSTTNPFNRIFVCERGAT